MASLMERAGVEEAGYTERRLHLAMALFIAGVLLVLAGAVLLVAAQWYPPTLELSMRYTLRQIGGLTAGLGVVVLFLGLLAALYTKRYMRWLGLAGGCVTVAGLAGFAWAYPFNWGVPGQPDWSGPVALTLLSGATTLIAATFAAMVSNMVLRMRVRGALRDEFGREPTDEEVNRDIDEALRRHRYTWGGIVERADHGLRFRDEPIPPEFLAMGWKERKHESGTEALDASQRMLNAFRGGRMRTGELDQGKLDASAGMLRRLRDEKAAAEARKPWNRFKTWLRRVWARFVGLFHHGAAH